MLIPINSQHTKGRQIGEIDIEELIKEVSAEYKMNFENTIEFEIYKGPYSMFRFYSKPGCPPKKDEVFCQWGKTTYSNGKLRLPEEIVAACTTNKDSVVAVDCSIMTENSFHPSIVVRLDIEYSR